VELVTRESNHGALQRLADAGGGLVAPASTPGALAAAYESIATSLVAEYRVTYRSTAHGQAHLHLVIAQDSLAAHADADLELPPAPASGEAHTPTRTPARVKHVGIE